MENETLALPPQRKWLARIVIAALALVGVAVPHMLLGHTRRALGYFVLSLLLVFIVIASVVFMKGWTAKGFMTALAFDLIINYGFLLVSFCHALSSRAAATKLKWLPAIAICIFGFASTSAAAWMMRTHYLAPFHSMTGSNLPTIKANETFFVDKRISSTGVTTRGELIVYSPRNVPNTAFVKRLIGLPGDRIMMRDGMLFINGTAVRKIEQGNMQIASAGQTVEASINRETLPNGATYQTLDLGDGREFDTTTEFVVPSNEVFVLGDNRDDSLDSRYSDHGFVPQSAIIGKAWFAWSSIFKPSDVRNLSPFATTGEDR